MIKSRLHLSILLLTGAFSVLATIHYVELPNYSLMWRAIGDAGHVPLFGLLAYIIFVVSVLQFGSRFANRWMHYCVTIMVVALLAGLSELFQVASPRDADFYDVARDLAGCLGWLGILATYDRRMGRFWDSLGSKLKPLVRVGSAFVVIVALSPVLIGWMAYQHRNSTFPLIAGFDSHFETLFLVETNAELERVPAPARWTSVSNGLVGKLTLFSAPYPGVSVVEPFPDWSGYQEFCFDLFSLEDTVVSLELRIDDEASDLSYESQYHRTLQVKPGLNLYRIPLEKIQKGPTPSKLDLHMVAAIHCFAIEPTDPLTIYADSFRLE